MNTSHRQVTRNATCLLAAWSFLALAARPALADCSKDTDCKGDRVCEAGRCVAPGSPPPASPPPADSALPPSPPAPQPSEPAASPPPPSGIRYEPAPPGDARPNSPPAAPPAAPPPVPTSAPAPTVSGPAPGTVELWISAEDGDAYDVSFGGPDASSSESCRTPCTLHAKPGPSTLYARGTRDYEQRIAVPGHATSVTLKTSCPWCFALGGAAFAASGFLVFLAARSFDDVPTCTAYSGFDLSLCNDDRSRFTVYGAVFAGGAVGLTVAGVVLLVRGAARGSSRAVLPDEAIAAPRLHFAGAGIRPQRDGGAAALSFTF